MHMHMTGRWAIVALALAPMVAADNSLRVVSFNIHGWRTADHKDNLPQLKELLRDIKPDVVCLNEVLHPFAAPPADHPYWRAVSERNGYGHPCPTGSQPDDLAATHLATLAQALGMRHFAFSAATETGSFFGRYPFGNCIMSRYPLCDVRQEVLHVRDADLSLGGQERTMVDLENRAVLSARLALPEGRSIGIAVTHLDHKAEELRARQIAEAIEHCEAAFSDGLPFLLMGDLNSFDRAVRRHLSTRHRPGGTPRSPAKSRSVSRWSQDMDLDSWSAICALYASKGWPPPHASSLVQQALGEAGFVDAFALQEAEHGAHPPPTCWTETRLDYLMLSRTAADLVADGPKPADEAFESVPGRSASKVQVVSHQTLRSDASDHLPLVCTLRLNF